MRRIIISMALLLTGCGSDSWLGFYYPDASNLYNDVSSGHEFETIQECRAWVNQQRRRLNPNGDKADDYECGLNCDTSGGKPYVCEETRR